MSPLSPPLFDSDESPGQPILQRLVQATRRLLGADECSIMLLAGGPFTVKTIVFDIRRSGIEAASS